MADAHEAAASVHSMRWNTIILKRGIGCVFLKKPHWLLCGGFIRPFSLSTLEIRNSTPLTYSYSSGGAGKMGVPAEICR